MPFQPPFFGKFGKQSKDLLSKKFDASEGHKLKTSTADGTTFETTLKNNGTGFDGSVKATRSFKEFGKAEVQCGSTGVAKAKIDITTLHKNANVIVDVDEKPSGSVKVEYAQDSVAVEASVAAGQKSTSVSASVALGMDGFSVGGAVDYDVSAASVTDLNGGVQYATKDYTAAVKSTNHMERLQASYYHRVSGDFEAAAQVDYNLSTAQRGFTVGGAYVVDNNSSVKFKVDNLGVLSTAWDQVLPNASLKYSIISKYDLSTKSSAAVEWGVRLSAGDTSD